MLFVVARQCREDDHLRRRVGQFLAAGRWAIARRRNDQLACEKMVVAAKTWHNAIALGRRSDPRHERVFQIGISCQNVNRLPHTFSIRGG